MIPGSVEFVWHGERLVLLPDRAAWLPEHHTLLVADVHLGKPASFRAAGVPVPESVTGRDLERLSGLLRAAGANRLLVLGDLVHDAAATRDRTRAAVRAWVDALRGVSVELAPGNHDRHAPGGGGLGVRVLGPCVEIGGLRLTHEPPEDGDHPATLCGHIHPVVSVGLRGVGGRVRTPCFWFDRGVGILPAFGTFTGGFALTPGPGHAVFAAGERSVIPVTRAAGAWAAGGPGGVGAIAYDGT